MAPIVIGVGPGFRAPDDVHAVVETQRGPHLGRVIHDGAAEENTGIPGPVGSYSSQRVLRAPVAGVLSVQADIGTIVRAGDRVASVSGLAVAAPFDGLVRGLLRDGATVQAGMKIGDLDPRLDPELARVVSDKALAVAGGVLEAILAASAGRLRT